jgi:methyl-accepting chemotaxis protein-1 (serine sensor receptor)
MSKLTVKARLAIVTSAVAAVLVTVGGVGLFGVQQGNAALRHVYEGRAQALQTISTIDELITQSQFAISDAVLDPSAQKTQAVVASTQQRIANVDALLGRYLRAQNGSPATGRRCATRDFVRRPTCSPRTICPKRSGS